MTLVSAASNEILAMRGSIAKGLRIELSIAPESDEPERR
jgi:hypothetical protein